MDKLKKDIIFLAGAVLAAFLLWCLPGQFKRGAPALVRVYQDGEEVASYPLMENQSVTIHYEDSRLGDESYNLLLIQEGTAFISDADCPDRLCTRQKAISRNGESIICLPHRLVVQIESGEESDLDALTY